MIDSVRARCAIVCCSGGGMLDALCSLAPDETPVEMIGVITDRACGAESVASRHGLAAVRIEEPECAPFSRRAAATLAEWAPDIVLLLFLRRVGEAIWGDPEAEVWNLHPSLLPHYRGLGALERNFGEARTGAEALGVTIHRVKRTPDTGDVVAQGRFRALDAPTLERAAHLGFLLKLALFLEAAQSFLGGTLLAIPQERVDGLAWHGAFRGLQPRRRVLEICRRSAQPWAQTWLDGATGAVPS